VTNAAAELVASKPNVLLDFDGPICSVFGGVGADTAARQLRDRLGLSEQHSAEVRDPFEILRYAAAEGQREAIEAERELTKLEVEAVATATPTPGAAELLRCLAGRGHRMAIVSNNSVAAVRAYLENHGLAGLVNEVSARTDADPTRLKPGPYLLHQAFEQLGVRPERCVMIGDSFADIQAAQVANVEIIAYANKPTKQDRFARYAPVTIVSDLYSLTVT